MQIFNHPEFDGHENVIFASDLSVGLKTIIAVHSTKLGPATGGCRIWEYPNDDAALCDALRLSRGMTYKNAIAGLDLGGGKAVIVLAKGQIKTPELMRAFGKVVEDLHGKYITAEDVGATTADMALVRSETTYVSGLMDGDFASGDPSPVTARGVFEAIRIACRHKLGRDSLNGVKVAVQGIGSVGWHLCQMLHANGAYLIVTDTNLPRCAEAASQFGAQVAPVDGFHRISCDVYAPCALGGDLHPKTIAELDTRIVAGAANNQLRATSDADLLHTRGILYLPDFLINAGGIINVASEIARVQSSGDWVSQHLANLLRTIEETILTADQQNRSPHHVALQIARRRFEKTLQPGPKR